MSETWKLVPVEPTQEMVRAGIWALDAARERDGKQQDPRPYTPHEKHAIRYRAMLAAAPTAPSQEPGGMPGVEAVARLLCKQDGFNPDDPRSHFDDEPLWTEWRDHAQQVIALFSEAFAAAVAVERERCAKVAEKIGQCANTSGRGAEDERFADDIAAAIRSP